MDDKQEKALTAALSQIERQFGKGRVMRWAIMTAWPCSVDFTGSRGGLDIALGLGGPARGACVVEIYGR